MGGRLKLMLVRSFSSTSSRPASGRPSAALGRQPHDSHRGAGLTLHLRWNHTHQPGRSNRADGVWVSTHPSEPVQLPQPSRPLSGADHQPESARRKRSASARSFAATSAARSACSLASAASGPPSAASLQCTRATSCSVAATASAARAICSRSALLCACACSARWSRSELSVSGSAITERVSCDFSGQGLRVQLLYWVVVEVALVLMHALHRAEAHVPALATSGWLYPWPCRITGSWRSGLAAHRRRAWRRPSRTVPHRVAWLLRLEGSVRGVRGAVSGGWRATPAEAPGAGAPSW
jgi:hypothetical protein